MRKNILAAVLLAVCAMPAQNLLAGDIFCRRNRMIAEGVAGGAALATYLVYDKKVKAVEAQLTTFDADSEWLPGDTLKRGALERELRKNRRIRNTALGVLVASGLLLVGEGVYWCFDKKEIPPFKPTVTVHSIGQDKYVITDGQNIITKKINPKWYSLAVTLGNENQERLLFRIDKEQKEKFDEVQNLINTEINKETRLPGDLNVFIGSLQNLCSDLPDGAYDLRQNVQLPDGNPEDEVEEKKE